VDQDDATGDDYIEDFNLNFEITGVAANKTASSFALLIDDDGDGDFSNARIHREGLTVVDGDNVSFTGVDFPDGAIFTLATEAPGPGGVSNGLGIWLKANVGGASWTDQSGNAVTATPINSPALSADLLNFNDAVSFNGTSQYYDFDNNLGFDGVNDGHSIYTVIIDEKSTGFGSVLGGQIEANGAPQFLTQGSDPRSIYFDADGSGNEVSSSGAINSFQPTIVSADIQSNTNLSYFFNGVTDVSVTNFTETFSDNNLRFGARENGGSSSSFFEGDIAELIVYTSSTITDRNKIESYLAIKYGITLNNGTTAYLDSQGDIVWPVDANYASDIFGIANDAAQGLDQQISKSINNNTILTVSTDADFTTVNGTHTSLTDGQFLLVGNDGNSGSSFSAINTDLDLTIYYERIAREWKSTNTGSIGAVNLQFDGFDDTWVLLTRTTDGDFSASTGTTATALSATGTVEATLTGTSFFTLARLATSVEFEVATANDVEATGGNLPNLLINGTLNDDTIIDLVINGAGTATANTDYTLS